MDNRIKSKHEQIIKLYKEGYEIDYISRYTMYSVEFVEALIYQGNISSLIVEKTIDKIIELYNQNICYLEISERTGWSYQYVNRIIKEREERPCLLTDIEKMIIEKYRLNGNNFMEIVTDPEVNCDSKEVFNILSKKYKIKDLVLNLYMDKYSALEISSITGYPEYRIDSVIVAYEKNEFLHSDNCVLTDEEIKIMEYKIIRKYSKEKISKILDIDKESLQSVCNKFEEQFRNYKILGITNKPKEEKDDTVLEVGTDKVEDDIKVDNDDKQESDKLTTELLIEPNYYISNDNSQKIELPSTSPANVTLSELMKEATSIIEKLGLGDNNINLSMDTKTKKIIIMSTTEYSDSKYSKIEIQL